MRCLLILAAIALFLAVSARAGSMNGDCMLNHKRYKYESPECTKFREEMKQQMENLDKELKQDEEKRNKELQERMENMKKEKSRPFIIGTFLEGIINGECWINNERIEPQSMECIKMKEETKQRMENLDRRLKQEAEERKKNMEIRNREQKQRMENLNRRLKQEEEVRRKNMEIRNREQKQRMENVNRRLKQEEEERRKNMEIRNREQKQRMENLNRRLKQDEEKRNKELQERMENMKKEKSRPFIIGTFLEGIINGECWINNQRIEPQSLECIKMKEETKQQMENLDRNYKEIHADI